MNKQQQSSPLPLWLNHLHIPYLPSIKWAKNYKKVGGHPMYNFQNPCVTRCYLGSEEVVYFCLDHRSSHGTPGGTWMALNAPALGPKWAQHIERWHLWVLCLSPYSCVHMPMTEDTEQLSCSCPYQENILSDLVAGLTVGVSHSCQHRCTAAL
jgi:hypothetical protein